jgi:hypothetical protein
MEEIFTINDGRQVKIKVDDMDYKATVLTSPGDKIIGSLEFREIGSPEENFLKITNAFLDRKDGSYLRQGIGRRCLTIVAEISGLKIIASDDDGIRKDDGSHLTGDAPGFIAKMRQRMAGMPPSSYPLYC